MNKLPPGSGYDSGSRGSSTLPAYRHYRLDGTGNISEAEWLEAIDDEDAIRQVLGRDLPMPSEIWDRDRHVARVDPQNPR